MFADEKNGEPESLLLACADCGTPRVAQLTNTGELVPRGDPDCFECGAGTFDLVTDEQIPGSNLG